jgi:hypothetical protein
LVVEPSRCVQVVDSFNVVHSAFIDAAFVRQTLADQDRCANQIARAQKTRSPGQGRGSSACCYFCLLLLLVTTAATLLRGRLSRRIHRRLVGADVTEQDGTVRQILLHQAGAGRRNRPSDHRVHRGHIVPAPVQVHMTVAVVAVVVVMAMAPEAAVDVPVTVVVMVVMMTVPVTVVVVPVPVLVTTVMTMTMTVGMTDHVAMTAMTTALVTALTATAGLTRIGSGRDERRKADNGGRDESEECRTFEHNQRPFGSM